MENKGRMNPARDRVGVERLSFKKERPGPYSKDRGFRPPSLRGPPFFRVFVNNIPYEEKWQNLKDIFRKKVGEVTYVELFTDENGKSRGYGVVEFKSKELCEEAVSTMNRYELNSRKLVVRADYDGELVKKMLLRDGIPHGGNNAPRLPPSLPPPMPGHPGGMPPMPPPMGRNGSMGMSNSMNNNPMMPNNGPMLPNNGPMGNTVFVANLDYKVTYSKLKEVFQLAGRVVKVDLMLDRDNKSRGMATITYEDPMEAAQAISMLNNQKLFDRTMIVKMDKDNSREKKGPELPSGLSGIGPSLSMRRDVGGLGDMTMNRPPPFMPSNNLLGGLGGLGAPNIPGLRDLNKPGGPDPGQIAAGWSALTQQASRLRETLQASSISGLAGIAGLGGMGDLSKLGLGGPDLLDHRILEQQRARLLAAAAQGAGLSDREKIELDIARVDNRIRDIDRSLAATERGDMGRNKRLPMPPPMGGGPKGPMRIPGTTVFVRNLPYSLTWQKLRDRFSRCGNVMFAEIKQDNGKSRGFGSVRFENPGQAEAAVDAFNGFELDGRKIEVHVDKRR